MEAILRFQSFVYFIFIGGFEVLMAVTKESNLEN